MFVPALAGLCAVHILDPGEDIPRLAAVSGDPPAESPVWGFDYRDPQDPTRADGVWETLQSGRSILYPLRNAAGAAGASLDGECTHLGALLGRLGSGSAMFVPLRGRERVLGAIALFSRVPARWYSATDLRLAEELAQRATMALEHADLYRRMQETFQAREEHLAVITHDLRSPLTKIALFAELLEPCLAARDPVDHEAVEWLGRIGNATRQMVSQIEELLDLHQVEAGCGIRLQRRDVDLVAMVEREVAVQQRLAKRHSLLLHTAQCELVGYWDSSRLERVISNVIENAVKYTPDGGTIRVSVAAMRDDGEDYATVAVEDEGIGIPQRDLLHIFEPFYRGANAATCINGTGIGLAVSQRIVERHGGAITVTSTEGVGTCVCLRLPL